MKKRSLMEALRDATDELVKALDNNPQCIEVNRNSKMGDDYYPVRVKFEERTDNTIPLQIVLEMPNFIKEPNSFDIATVIKDRILVKNQSAMPSMSQLSGVKPSGGKLNNEILSAVCEVESKLDIIKRKVDNGGLIYWDLMKPCFEDNIQSKLGLTDGQMKTISMDLDRALNSRKNQLLDLAETVIKNNLDEDGNSPLHKTKHIVDNMLSQSGIEKIEKNRPEQMGIIEGLQMSVNKVVEGLGVLALTKSKEEIEQEKLRQEEEKNRAYNPAELNSLLRSMGIKPNEEQIEAESKFRSKNKRKM